MSPHTLADVPLLFLNYWRTPSVRMRLAQPDDMRYVADPDTHPEVRRRSNFVVASSLQYFIFRASVLQCPSQYHPSLVLVQMDVFARYSSVVTTARVEKEQPEADSEGAYCTVVRETVAHVYNRTMKGITESGKEIVCYSVRG